MRLGAIGLGLERKAQEISKIGPHTVVIADDHPISLSGINFLLSDEEGLDVIGTAEDGDMALAMVDELSPDILIVDFFLPKKNGLIVAEQLCRRKQRPLILLISGQATGLNFKRALDVGVEGIVSKEDPSEEMLTAISTVLEGGTFLSSAVRKLIGPLSNHEMGSGDEHLSPREKEVLALIAQGMTSERIAEELSISPMTVKKHRENVGHKLGISNPAEATLWAARLGLLKI